MLENKKCGKIIFLKDKWDTIFPSMESFMVFIVIFLYGGVALLWFLVAYSLLKNAWLSNKSEIFLLSFKKTHTLKFSCEFLSQPLVNGPHFVSYLLSLCLSQIIWLSTDVNCSTYS